MQATAKKKLIRIFVGAFLLAALFVAYHWGVLHGAVFKIATATSIEWGESSPQAISIYFPRWACGPGQPPYLLVEAGIAEIAPLIGTHIRLEQAGSRGVDLGDYHFGECHGRFKNSLAMLIWEHGVMRVEGWGPDDLPATGRFFDTAFCEAREPSLEQSLKIDELMKPYREPD